MSEPPAFRLVDVAAAYPRRGVEPLRIFQGLTCDIQHGETVAVTGPSGSGKSTLVAILGLLAESDSQAGRIAFECRRGKVLEYGCISAGDRVRLRRESFGFLPQTHYLLPGFTALDNVAMPLALLGWNRNRRRARAAALVAELDRVAAESGVAPLANRTRARPAELSLGEKQRFAALRAVATDPQVVFADEPTSNLDAANAAAVHKILSFWKSGNGVFALNPAVARQRTLVFVTHDLPSDRSRHTIDRILHFPGQNHACRILNGEGTP